MSIQDTYLSNEDIEPDQDQTNIVNRFEKLQKEIIGEKKNLRNDSLSISK